MTGREVYNRIRWDSRIDAAKMTVGFEDRFRGTMELPFHHPKLGRDVPWHRLKHFRFEGRLVWDREGIDELDTILVAQAETANFPWRWSVSEQQWEEERESFVDWDVPLKLLTLNVLFDLYDTTVPSTESRFPGLLDLLQNSDADIICLQEVTPKLLALLLDHAWVRSTYLSSHSPNTQALTPYGQLLLSKLPCTVEHRALTAGKSVVQARFPFRSGSVELVVAHLFSNRSGDASEKRRAQLDEIRAYLSEDSSAWIVGDFNEAGLLPMDGFRDCWIQARPAEFGLTFCPSTNPLARKTSTSGVDSRYDRVLVRGRWDPGAVTMVDASAISDHEPLLVELLPPIDKGPVHRSALVVIPPEKLWPPIQAIREKNDKSFARWMPHINLIYGFLPEDQFKEAATRLAPLLQSCPRFKLRLREYRRFEHRGSTTVWLRPESEPPRSLERLQALLQSALPSCSEQNGHGPEGFTAHLTVASLKAGTREPRWPPIDLSFEVQSLAMISRRDDQPFEVRHELSLAASIEESLPPMVDNALVLESVAKRVEALEAKVYAVGSTALDLGLPWSDIDILGVGHRNPSELFPELGSGRTVPGRIPLWRGQFHGQKVDLQYAQFPAAWPLTEPLSAEQLAGQPPELGRALQSAREVAALRELVELDRLRPFLRAVRCWTHRRCLDSPPLGFPGGWAWTVLAARVLTREREARVEDLMVAFFEFLDCWPWPQPFSASATSHSYRVRATDRFPVLTLTKPEANLAANVTRGTLSTILREARRGHALAAQSRWNDVVAEMHPSTGFSLHLEASGDVLQAAQGWLESNFVGLMLAFEQRGCPLRSHRLLQQGQTVTLHCETRDSGEDSLLESFVSSFSQTREAAEGATLSWERT